MGLPDVMRTGHSGMMAAKTAISTTGHNITNANTEGYSRQRVETETAPTKSRYGKAHIGTGTQVANVTRINDEYLDKHIRSTNRDLLHYEEKELSLKQLEDVFNEMNGDGLNRIMSKFFNEFRKLSNDPDNEAVRQSVRESTNALANDFKRIRTEVDEIRKHIDSRISGYVTEINDTAEQIKELNLKIRVESGNAAAPNDLLDKRDQLLKKLASYMEVSVHKDNHGNVNVDIKGSGPLITGPNNNKFWVERAPADGEGKPDNAYNILSDAAASRNVTHILSGGKLGALVDVRDKTLSTVLDRIDDIAFQLAKAVNEVHSKGVTRYGTTGVKFFKEPTQKERAAEMLALSDEVSSNVNNIAAASAPNSPGDNRVAIAISGLQGIKIMNEGQVSFDDHYNSIVSDIGVLAARNRNSVSQQKDINSQLSKVREQVSGVSIDEETSNLLQYQHLFDASARVINVADEMMKTILSLGGR